MMRKFSINNKIKFFDDDSALKWYDWFLFAVLALLCYLLMQQSDLLHTGGASIGILNGHILDFYDYTAQYISQCSYMLSTYIIFAIWNIPIKLLGFVDVPTISVGIGITLWYKLLPTLFYMGSAYLMYLIASEMGMGGRKAKICAYLFLTAPLAFFSQFMFGQYDVITVFMMLLAIFYYIKGKEYKFALTFGIAITFKYYALLIFLPILLLKEKNIWKLVRLLLIALIPLFILSIPNLSSSAFQSGVGNFNALHYMTVAGFTTYIGNTISVVIVAWFGICGYAYMKNVSDNEELLKWMLWISNLSTYLLFGLCTWHPQWLLFAVPFMVLATMISIRKDACLFLDLLIMGAFTVYTVNAWPDWVDQGLFRLGVLGGIVGDKINTGLTMRELFVFQYSSILLTGFSGLLLISTIFRHPKYLENDFSISIDKQIRWIRARFLGGVAIFLIPAFICLASVWNLPNPLYSSGNATGVVGEIFGSNQISQVFTATSDSCSKVSFMVGTYARTNTSQLNVSITDVETGTVAGKASVNSSVLDDNKFNTINFTDVSLVVGQKYMLTFSAPDATSGNAVTIYYDISNPTTETYAVLNGKKQNYNLCVTILP